jgi:DNA-binding SARP family transcriptional activator
MWFSSCGRSAAGVQVIQLLGTYRGTARFRFAIDPLPSVGGVLEFRILGPLEVVDGDGPVALGGARQRATLAILLLSANRVVSVDRIADDLYAGATPVTAVAQVQRQISELRKALGSSTVIETRAPGYVIRIAPEQLDLDRFERQTNAAVHALGRGDAGQAARALREALSLWRGTPLADLADEPFARPSVERLDEIRLAAHEKAVEAELSLGRHAELVGELEELLAAHPLHERFRAQLMLALYRSGRQVEALDLYRQGRDVLVAELGLEPSPMLRELERAILAHDPVLGFERPQPESLTRAVLLVPSTDERVDDLLAVAEPLGQRSGQELIVARLLVHESELPTAVSALNRRLVSISVPSRAAAFTTADPTIDVLRLATSHDVDLVLLDATSDLAGGELPSGLASMLGHCSADVGLLACAQVQSSGSSVVVPFGGGRHDWAALELAAWFAAAVHAPVKLIGTRADAELGRRDASRLLADAALAVQSVVGVETSATLADPTEEGLVEAVEGANLVVVGFSPRWRRDGIGDMRRALVRDARVPVLLVHRGPRPGGLAPGESATRFSWSIELTGR